MTAAPALATSGGLSRRIVISGSGGPEVMSVVEGPRPKPRRGQARLRTLAAGVAYGDVMRRRGVLAPPWSFTPGYDVVGVIEAVGAGVDPARIGQRAAVFMPKVGFGGYAEHVCVPAKRLVPVPDGVPADEALALGLNYITALQILTRHLDAQPGQRLLVHGASGGVGTAVLDLGAPMGLTLYGTASARKHDAVRARGATPIDYRSEDFVERVAELTDGAGVHAALDPIGGVHLARTWQTLRPDGTLVAFGVSGDVSRGMAGVAAGMKTLLGLWLRRGQRRIRFYAISSASNSTPSMCVADWTTLLAMRARGELAPQIGARFPLVEAAQAHALMEGGGVVGKIVLVCE